MVAVDSCIRPSPCPPSGLMRTHTDYLSKQRAPTAVERSLVAQQRRTFHRGGRFGVEYGMARHFNARRARERSKNPGREEWRLGAALICDFDADSAASTTATSNMYSGTDRPAWHPASPPPQSQPGWFPLQESHQQPQQQSQNGWAQDAAAKVLSTSSQDQRTYTSSPMYSAAPTPPYVWTGEPHAQSSPPPRFLPSATYHPRPLILSDSELYDRAQDSSLPLQSGSKPNQGQTVLRRSKQIAIGRWNSEEHQWFLKGLEMFQGPAWGEIARLIGTRTSTQVRTHAQKFFTKLARLNQTMPYFEVQIERERARLVALNANVTPTAQSAPSATLSPRKRLATASNSPRQSLKRFKEEAAAAAASVQARYPQETYGKRPPRVYTGSSAGSYSSASEAPEMAKECPQQWTSDDARPWPLESPTSDGGQQSTSNGAAAVVSDSESLPSMNKLLFRGSTAV